MNFNQMLDKLLVLRDKVGDLAGAERLANQLIKEKDKLSPDQLAVLYREFGSLLRYRGKMDQAVKAYTTGLRFARKTKDAAEEINLLRLIGFTTLKTYPQTKVARRWASRAVAKLTKLRRNRYYDESAANVWALVGNIESTDKDTRQAVLAYRKGLVHAKKAKFYARMATLLGDLANKYIDLGRYRDAEKALKEDVNLSKKYHRHSYPNALVRLSYLYYLPKNPRRDLKKAWKYAQEALRVAKKEGWGREVADAYQRLGKIAWYMGKHPQSRRYLLLAMQQYKKVKHVAYAKWVIKVMKDLEQGKNSHHDYPQE